MEEKLPLTLTLTRTPPGKQSLKVAKYIRLDMPFIYIHMNMLGSFWCQLGMKITQMEQNNNKLKWLLHRSLDRILPILLDRRRQVVYLSTQLYIVEDGD